jgi:hypothetical protein
MVEISCLFLRLKGCYFQRSLPCVANYGLFWLCSCSAVPWAVCFGCFRPTSLVAFAFWYHAQGRMTQHNTAQKLKTHSSNRQKELSTRTSTSTSTSTTHTHTHTYLMELVGLDKRGTQHTHTPTETHIQTDIP